MGGFNDKEHRYYSVVPDRVKNVFSGPIMYHLYKLDAILGFEAFLVFEIFKGGVENFGLTFNPQITYFFAFSRVLLTAWA